MSCREEIISILKAFASIERMGSFFVDNATPDFLFIGPSGNPIYAKGFQKYGPQEIFYLNKQRSQKYIDLKFSHKC